MSPAQIALLVFSGTGLLAMIVLQANLVRQRRNVAPQRRVDFLTAVAAAVGVASVVAFLVAISLGHDTSRSTAASDRALIWTFVINALTTILLVLYVLVRHFRVRKATERNGEPLLTRRGSLHVNALPPEALYWAKVALRSADTYNLSVDSRRLQITAQARAHWSRAALHLIVEVQSVADGSDLYIAAWPDADLATHDLGTVQYFIDNLLKDFVAVSEDPPEPETPETETRELLREVSQAPTVEEPLRAGALEALDLLDTGRSLEAAVATRRVVDAVRSLSPMDPARRITERDIDRTLEELATDGVSSPDTAEPGD